MIVSVIQGGENDEKHDFPDQVVVNVRKKQVYLSLDSHPENLSRIIVSGTAISD
jgi:hypothetical protein